MPRGPESLLLCRTTAFHFFLTMSDSIRLPSKKRKASEGKDGKKKKSSSSSSHSWLSTFQAPSTSNGTTSLPVPASDSLDPMPHPLVLPEASSEPLTAPDALKSWDVHDTNDEIGVALSNGRPPSPQAVVPVPDVQEQDILPNTSRDSVAVGIPEPEPEAYAAEPPIPEPEEPQCLTPKDNKYYFESGDCTFLVGGVLFKVHKYGFQKDPDSAFANMFKDAQGDVSAPIPLSDSSEDFRLLCWVLYAPLSKIFRLATQPNDNIDVKKYLRILDIAHKYTLVDVETWAWSMAQLNPSAMPSHLDSCSEGDLVELFGLAMRCSTSAREFVQLVETAWLGRVKRDELRCSRALTVGEYYGRREFQGNLFMEMRNRLTNGSIWTSPQLGLQNLHLTKVQSDRLLLGFVTMASQMASIRQLLSSELPIAGANLNRSFGPSHYHISCEDEWRTMCHERSFEYDNPVGARLILEDAGKSAYYTCVIERFQVVAADLKQYVPDKAADYFLGPVVSATPLQDKPPEMLPPKPIE
ncbi:hypothetical protein MIND_00811500 [Mycena indigotica]|uniref:BTB domain-containing protein n=1 Tax=Mycena indigotica TaxID=2126181 RepID=A0A8H6W463_9AGAR|nr:uncharacterized protein MIND_00811500 [Mycena indigotica]KAF7298644.1 hypothetical protein MIND_00811500 [Mycena indigotica]